MDTLKDSLSQGEGKGMMLRGRNEFFKYVKKDTMGETYKHLNKLIKDKSIYKLVDVNDLVSGVDEELPIFEESLKLIVIDGLRLENKVVEILLSQENYQIKRILKCNWFFRNSLSVETYCRDIIPKISLKLRFNLLTKLSNNMTSESEAEALCDFVRLTYKNQQAELLMPRCSSKYILNYYSDGKSWPRRFVQSSRNLLKISRRHPEVGMCILSTLFSEFPNDNSLSENYKKVLIYLAGNHLNIFIPFFEKHKSHLSFLKFGKHLSRRLGLKLKEAILTSDGLWMTRNFKEKRFYKALSFGDKVKYITARVRSNSKDESLKLTHWSSSHYSFNYLLKWVKEQDRLPMIQAVFKQLYNVNYEDYPKLWHVEFLEWISLDQRLIYAEKYIKWIEDSDEAEDPDFPKPTEPVNYVHLLDFDKAFMKLKKLHSRAPEFYQRQEILSHMVRSCSLNKDPANLDKLLEYVTERHRNDDAVLISAFLTDACRAFKLSAVSTASVEKIENLAYYCTFKDQTFFFPEVMEKCILHRLEKGLDVGKQVQRVFDVVILQSNYPRVFLKSFTSEHSRMLFFKYYELIMKWMADHPEDEKSKEMLPLSIVDTLLKFNSCNKRDPIRVRDLEEFLLVLKKLIENKTEETESVEELVDLMEKYRTRVWERNFKMKYLRWIFRQNPNRIGEKRKEVLEYLFCNFGNYGEDQIPFFMKFLKLISFLEKTSEVKEAILKKFGDKNSQDWHRTNALSMYSRMANWDEFERTIEDYIPKSEKVDFDLERDFVEIQFTVPRVMRHVRPSWKCLPLMLKFFRGDFLKVVMQSFYPCCYSTGLSYALRTLRGYLDDIEHDKRISIRKDVIRIIGDITTRRHLLEFYPRCWEEINHYSIRTVLLRFVGKCFVEVPTRETFKIVQKFIEESDNLVIQGKPDIGRIPNSFLNDYVLSLWKFSEKEKAKFRNDFRNSILRFFDYYNMRFLSNEFCENIIKSNLFITKSPLEVNDFAIAYLINDSETFNRKMGITLDLLRSRMSDTEAVSTFCSSLRSISWQHPSLMYDFFDLLIKHWPKYSTGVMYVDLLTLNYCRIYHEALKRHEERMDQEEDVISVEFGKGLKKYFSSFKNLKDMVFVLWNSLEDFISEATGHNSSFDVFAALNELATSPTETSLCLMAVLGSTHDFYNQSEEKKKKVDKLIETLRSHQDETIEIYVVWKHGLRKEPVQEVPMDVC